MKKIFGTIFLLVGVAFIGLGIFAVTDLNTKKDSFEGKLKQTFDDSYREKNRQQEIVGYASLAGGVIILILGFMKVSAKSSR